MGEEYALIKEVTQLGPLYLGLVLIYLFIVQKFWPWWTGPRQVAQEKRWQADQDRTQARELQIKDLTDNVIRLFEQHQDGEREQTRKEHSEMRDAIASMAQSIDKLIAVSDARDKRLEDWVKVTVGRANLDVEES